MGTVVGRRPLVVGQNTDQVLACEIGQPRTTTAAFRAEGQRLTTNGQRRFHFSLAPTGTSSRKLASTGFPFSSDAATIMPFDSRPRSLRGARLATITTLRPTRGSGAYASAIP